MLTDTVSRCILHFRLMETSGERLWSPEPGREIAVVDGPHWLGLVRAAVVSTVCVCSPGAQGGRGRPTRRCSSPRWLLSGKWVISSAAGGWGGFVPFLCLTKLPAVLIAGFAGQWLGEGVFPSHLSVCPICCHLGLPRGWRFWGEGVGST